MSAFFSGASKWMTGQVGWYYLAQPAGSAAVAGIVTSFDEFELQPKDQKPTNIWEGTF